MSKKIAKLTVFTFPLILTLGLVTPFFVVNFNNKSELILDKKTSSNERLIFNVGADTIPKANINISEIVGVVEGINDFTYSLDLENNTALQNSVISAINKKPSLFFDNSVTAEEMGQQNVVNRNEIISFESINAGNAVKINGSFLMRTSGAIGYKRSSIVINGFNDSNTIVISSYLEVTKELSSRLPSQIDTDNKVLSEFLGQEYVLRRCFRNFPESFITKNAHKIKINFLNEANNNNGTLEVNITVNDAKISNSPTGYGSMTASIKLRGFDRYIKKTTLIPSIDISSFELANANNEIYSIDLLNSSNSLQLKRDIISTINNFTNIDKMLISPPTREQVGRNEIFRILGWEYGEKMSEVLVTCQFLTSETLNSSNPIYENGQFLITGFKKSPTTTFARVDSVGLIVPGISSVWSDELYEGTIEWNSIVKYLSRNIATIFYNYPEIFQSVNSQNISFEIIKDSADRNKGMLRVNVNVQYAWNGDNYVNARFPILLKGFRKQYAGAWSKNIDVRDLINLDPVKYRDLDKVYAQDLLINENPIKNQMLNNLKISINENPEFFFHNYKSNYNNDPAIQEGTDLNFEKGDGDDFIYITGNFQQWDPNEGRYDFYYEKMNIAISGFNSKTTFMDNVAFNNNIFPKLGIDKKTTSNFDAVNILNSLKKSELISLINNNLSSLLPANANNLPYELIKLINTRNVANQNNVKVNSLGVTQIEIHISNLPICSSRAPGKVTKGTLSVSVGGFSSSNKNTIFIPKEIDAVNNWIEFHKLFPNNKGYTVDWATKNWDILGKEIKDVINSNQKEFFENPANVEPVQYAEIQSINENVVTIELGCVGFIDGYYDPRNVWPVYMQIKLKPFPKTEDFSTLFDIELESRMQLFFKTHKIEYTPAIIKVELEKDILVFTEQWIDRNQLQLPDTLIQVPFGQRVSINERGGVVVAEKIDKGEKYFEVVMKNRSISIGPSIWDFVLPSKDIKLYVTPGYVGDIPPNLEIEVTTSPAIIWISIGVASIVVLVILILAIVSHASKRRKLDSWLSDSICEDEY